MIKIENIHKSYGNVEVLKGIDLNVEKGEIISIVGASGAGKTTLLQIIGTLEKPDEGNIIINNTDVNALSEKKLSEFRNSNIGFVFQFHHLLPEFTALENILMPAMIKQTPRKEMEERARLLMDFLKISHRAGHKPSELSGGEQQRVAVARALINTPAVVLADEPSGNLDSVNARELHNLFFELRRQYNQTFIIVTHNEEFAEMADRKITMRDGKSIE
ncbi:MAG: ABC transporter ATP-binding protein [Bacteroides sp.]|nr:ABC transporter ATP-binding protein [Bacteroidales bacterium]MBQ5819586.1 ABC transporter ATP-binding protein [Bacteroides sp.]